jgi:hypothetical protein
MITSMKGSLHLISQSQKFLSTLPYTKTLKKQHNTTLCFSHGSPKALYSVSLQTHSTATIVSYLVSLERTHAQHNQL